MMEYNGRFQIIRRRNSCRLDLSLLAATIAFRFPVVVCLERRAATIVQLKDRVSQKARHASIGERWTYPANDHLLWVDPRDNESADQYVVSCLHTQARRDVQGLTDGRGKLGGVAVRIRGGCSHVLTGVDLGGDELEAGVAICVSDNIGRTNKGFSLTLVREELDPISGIRDTIQRARDGSIAATLRNRSNNRKILEIIRSAVAVAGVIWGRAIVSEINPQSIVGIDRIA